MFKRALVKKITERSLEKRKFIQIVTGARQTGKTTAVQQAIKSVKIPRLFISADEAAVLSREWLSNEWQKARNLEKKQNKETLLIIDEIQKIPQWSSTVKQMWDQDSRNNISLKVLLTGSSSLLIQKGLKESLAGRFEVINSAHWSFSECKKAFGYSLDDFLFFGGYPGAAALKNDETRWAQYIGNSIVEPTISQDIFLMEEIRKPALLMSLFKLGAIYSGQELSYTKLLGQLQDAGNTVTLAHYLDLLNKANILCGLQKFSSNKIKVRQSSPCFMVYDTSLMTYSDGASRKRFLENPESKGRLVESAVGAYLLARSKEEGFETFYWREKNSEVDFILQKGNSLTAIEVKSGRIKGFGGSLAFKKLYPNALSIVIGTQNTTLEDFLLGKIDLF
ncbi:MAG: AAA family ATPase [Endomicrobium sp.]|jgi:predicted AAA+ superfamily ATPase|nr:AAA family ATPase [Endomicrobium sp.]